MASHKVARFIFFCLFALQCLSCAKLKCPPTPKESILPVVIPLISTLAGSGKNGYVDAADTQAYFGKPCGVAVDNEGNVYVGTGTIMLFAKLVRQGQLLPLLVPDSLAPLTPLAQPPLFMVPAALPWIV